MLRIYILNDGAAGAHHFTIATVSTVVHEDTAIA